MEPTYNKIEVEFELWFKLYFVPMVNFINSYICLLYTSCKEFTQVTVDPASCWGFVLAKDLDNGSHDNCIETLHFAAAKMVDIEKARKDYEKRMIDSCGYKAYWDNKSWYDACLLYTSKMET